MTTPAFITQDSTFTAIQYFTALDPYYYTVDNRPLTNFETNVHNTNYGVDAARRAVVLETLANSFSHQDSYTSATKSTGFGGLQPTLISSSVLNIGPGAIYDTRNINASVTSQVVKTAFMTTTWPCTLTAPVTGGYSQIYTIEGVFLDINDTTMATSDLPYVDSTNTFLPSNIMSGELQLYVNAGTATSGTPVAPTTTSGNYPLYNVLVTNAGGVISVSLHPNAPFRKGLNKIPTPIAANSNATLSIINNTQMYSLAHATTGSPAGLILPISIVESNLNPYAPIKLAISYSPVAPTTGGNNITLNVLYDAFTTNSIQTTTGVTTSNDIVYLTTNGLSGGSAMAANSVQTFNTVNAVIPNTAFAGFVAGVWSVNVAYLNIVLQRALSDVNTAAINVMSVAVYQ